MSLTSNQYASGEGLLCPVCEARCSAEGGPVEIDGGKAWQNVYCTECDAEWTDEYVLVGFDSLVKGDK